MCSVAIFMFLFCLDVIRAELYVVKPFQGSQCHANQPCTVTWLDDGRSPLLSSIGVSTVGLYIGNHQLIQTLPPVDVNSQRSLTFTPNPAAGPNFDGYYVAFTSATYKVNGTTLFIAFSPFFCLSGMSGSSDSPYPPATSSIPIPPSLTNTPSSTSTSTITVGTLYSTPMLPATPTTTPPTAASGFVTSILPSSTTVNDGRISPTTSSLSTSGSTSNIKLPLSALPLCLLLPIFVSSSIVLLS